MVRRAYEALNDGDWDGFFRDMHPDVELTTQRGPGAGTRRSREGVQGFVEDYVDAFDGMVIEPEEFLENGDRVLAIVTRRGRPKGGSIDMVVRNGHLWTVGDGKLLSMKSYPDPDEGREALGLKN
jgi:ketosteroid isomerase-like protein